MNIFQRLWAMLVYAWYQVSGKEDAQYQSSAEHPQDVIQPRADKIAQTPAEYDQPVDQQEESLQLMISLITANAETYEMDQRAYGGVEHQQRAVCGGGVSR